MYEHFAEAIKQPDLIAIAPGLSCLRFDTMKVYSTLSAVKHLLDTGRINSGDSLIDSSSGIYAYALALACHRYGMKCHIVASTTVDDALVVQLRILGATLERVKSSASLRLDQSFRVQRIAELLDQNPSLHWMRQYHDDIHYLGYQEVAELIDREIPTGSLGIVGGVGTGASTGALATYLRAAGRDVELIGVQPFGSMTFGSAHIRDPDVIIAGIGSSIEFENVRHQLYDRIHWISFDHAASATVALLRSTAIFAGLSTGASYLATRWEHRSNDRRTYIFIAADTGHRYMDAVFNRYQGIDGIEDLRPHEITSPAELVFPWSTMNWFGRPAPEHGQHEPE
ncbi:MAG: pyridoxal-phosphate dependent enzyme [Pseudonocardia sp.]